MIKFGQSHEISTTLTLSIHHQIIQNWIECYSYNILQPMENANTNNQANPSEDEPELLRYENISYRILLQKDRAEAMKILVEEFVDQEPLSNAAVKLLPQLTHTREKVWADFWGLFMDQAINNHLSIGIFDADKNLLVGIVTTRDLNFESPQFQQLFVKGENIVTPMMAIQEELIKQTTPETQELLKQKNVVMIALGFALRKPYMGRQLIYRAVLLAEALGAKAGYKYSFVYATNFRSSNAVTKIGYENLGSLDCREVEQKGVKIYSLVDELCIYPTIWLKKIV